MHARQIALGLLACAGLSCTVADIASAAMIRPLWRQNQNYRAPAAAATPVAPARNGARVANPSGQGGWNANNTWYTQAPYGNYAPPPYATSRSAFYQVGPVPAFGGVRSLPGWGGAR